MPSMGSMMGGMQMPSLGMDDMMSKMMGGMNMGGMNMGGMNMGSSMQSSSFSSMMSTDMGGMGMGMPSLGMGMPPMRGMEMPGFPSMPGMSIEEMTSVPPTPSPAPREEYTVTSPPMSPPPPELHHQVAGSADYAAAPPGQAAEQTLQATVLLKVKDGDEYKLALNMQQYSPEDITIKLNGNELVVEAAGHGEQFRQKHVIPDNIDLDAMSSSFSSDGVLVIKAPKK